MIADRDEWDYHFHMDLAPAIRRLLKANDWAPRLEKLPLPIGRRLMEFSSQLTSPRRNRKLLETVHMPFPDQAVRIRMWEPREPSPSRPAVFYLHGGGWVLGSSRSHRAFCELIAEQASCAVFSVDYRRAPEHPFPAALGDVEQSFQWLLTQRKAWGWEDQPLVVAGDSAGGNLATVLCRRLRDQGAQMPDAQMLLYPVTDLARNTVSYQKYATGFLLTRTLMDWFYLHYQVAGHAKHPDVSPLHCPSLKGLPPAFIGLAGCDILLDEGRAYAGRLQEAGVPVKLRIFPNMIHAFVNLLKIPEARAAALESISFLQELFQRHPPKRRDHPYG
jgi:acetyl esterase